MKILTESGSIINYELKEDLNVSVADNDFWVIDEKNFKVKNIIGIFQDRRENVEEVDTDLYLYTSLSSEPIIIKNVLQKNVDFRCSSKTNLLFDINFHDSDIIFHFRAEYIVGLFFKNKIIKSNNIENEFKLSLSCYNKMISFKNIDNIKKIEAEGFYILNIKTNSNEEGYFKNINSYWKTTPSKTGNCHYKFILSNNKYIVLNNKQEIDIKFINNQLEIQTEDSSVLFAYFNKNIIAYEKSEKPFNENLELSVHTISDNFFVKHI